MSCCNEKICGNCKNSHYLQDEPYADTYISGWYCEEWMSLVEYDETCDKWKEEDKHEKD